MVKQAIPTSDPGSTYNLHSAGLHACGTCHSAVLGSRSHLASPRLPKNTQYCYNLHVSHESQPRTLLLLAHHITCTMLLHLLVCHHDASACHHTTGRPLLHWVGTPHKRTHTSWHAIVPCVRCQGRSSSCSAPLLLHRIIKHGCRVASHCTVGAILLHVRLRHAWYATRADHITACAQCQQQTRHKGCHGQARAEAEWQGAI